MNLTGKCALYLRLEKNGIDPIILYVEKLLLCENGTFSSCNVTIIPDTSGSRYFVNIDIRCQISTDSHIKNVGHIDCGTWSILNARMNSAEKSESQECQQSMC